MEVAKVDRSKTWTVRDYLELGEDLLAQLIEGELIMSPSPNTKHQRVLRKLYDIVNGLKPNGELFFAPFDVYVNDKNVFQPDLMFISEKKQHIITHRGVEGAPDLVVEIISPSNSIYDRNVKKKKYLEFGVAEYWIIDPANQTLEIYTTDLDIPSVFLVEKGEIRSGVLEEKSFDLNEVFE